MSGNGPRRNAPKPIFGVEIEIFVKVKPAVANDVGHYRASGAALPQHWRDWNFRLSNARPENVAEALAQARQRNHVKSALTALITDALGRRAGWKVVGDASLQEWKLTAPPDPRRWCKSPLYTFTSARA
jgi:hypothetical protein